jgi:NhaP-type Na+/H+ and K+/H+ antiporter
MKHLLLFIFAVSVLGCKNTSKNSAETSDNLNTIQGNYIFFEDAAVLQNDAEIYGVFLNDMARQLNEKAAQFKETDTDMVSVEVKGIVSAKDDPKILWENKLEIVEIISVSAVKETENILKLGTE